jgi:Protein of unknown function (DUF2555)
MTLQTISKQAIESFTASEVEELAQRLDQDGYTDVFEELQDWHLLRAIAFQRPELVEPYLYLLEMEAYDES